MLRCVFQPPTHATHVLHSCRVIDARGELAVMGLLRPEGAAGTLDLSACGFDTLPSIIWELPGRITALQELHLASNRLHTLPDVSTQTQLST